jgi:hypothetical protein
MQGGSFQSGADMASKVRVVPLKFPLNAALLSRTTRAAHAGIAEVRMENSK